jgi:hypothetical protein
MGGGGETAAMATMGGEGGGGVEPAFNATKWMGTATVVVTQTVKMHEMRVSGELKKELERRKRDVRSGKAKPKKGGSARAAQAAVKKEEEKESRDTGEEDGATGGSGSGGGNEPGHDGGSSSSSSGGGGGGVGTRSGGVGICTVVPTGDTFEDRMQGFGVGFGGYCVDAHTLLVELTHISESAYLAQHNAVYRLKMLLRHLIWAHHAATCVLNRPNRESLARIVTTAEQAQLPLVREERRIVFIGCLEVLLGCLEVLLGCLEQAQLPLVRAHAALKHTTYFDWYSGVVDG